MTNLAVARAELVRWEQLALRYPDNAAIRRARARSWDAWWVAVRNWRLRDPDLFVQAR